MSKIKIGLIGEDPSDTVSIKNLLKQEYDIIFEPVLKRITGSQLDSIKYERLLITELKTKSKLPVF